MKTKMDKRCPKGLKFLPDKPCELGKNKAERMQNSRSNIEKVDSDECVWYINDESCCFCYFKYMETVGKGKEHTLQEVANLFCTSINNIKLRETESLNSAKKHIAKNIKDLKDGFEV